jgi:hypothetical protein
MLENNKMISQTEFKTWLSQAATQAEAAPKQKQTAITFDQVDEGVEKGKVVNKPVLKNEQKKQTAVSPATDRWKPFASFVVEYQVQQNKQSGVALCGQLCIIWKRMLVKYGRK